MKHPAQIKIPATYMRGGTSKGVFFNLLDLPPSAQVAGNNRDKLLMRVIGSPDPYGKQTDGMGGATSSTSKVVVVSKSEQADHDVDYLFGQVAIDKPFIDWAGNCGNLTAAVGSFAVTNRLVSEDRIPENGVAVVRIWQANIKKTIIAHVPITNGEVQETGDFELDGVTFPAAQVKIEFVNPVGDGALFPTGNLVDNLEVPSVGTFKASMINAGIPTIFLNAKDLGYKGVELQNDINSDDKALFIFEKIRAYGGVQMGVLGSIEDASTSQHVPKIAFVSQPSGYTSSSGKEIAADDIDLNVRALSMGKLHHAMMGTAAVAIAIAAAVPGTLVNLAGGKRSAKDTCFGHPSGTLTVGTDVELNDGKWMAKKVTMSRSARVLMEGRVHIP